MKLELTLPRARFVVEETIEATLRLHNDGAEPVRVPDPFRNDAWQPTYVITGPEFPQGRRFSARSATSRGRKAAGGPLATLELGPGQAHEGELPLSLWCPIAVPGAYTLVVELDHGEGEQRVVARSQPLAFELEPLAAGGVSVGVDVLREPPGDLHVSFVHAADTEPMIYDSLFVEDRPDLGELRRASLEPRRVVPPDMPEHAPGESGVLGRAGVLGRTVLGHMPSIERVLVPWCNVDRMTAIAAFRAWTSGGALHGDDSPLGPAVALPLPPGASVLPPAWQDPSEALDVLVLDAGRRRLHLARFTSHGPPAPPTGALVWHGETTGPITGARLALGPPAQGGLRRAIAVETHGRDLVVSCFAPEPGAGAAPLGSLVLPELDPVPGGGLALRVMPDGRTKAWLLVDAKDPGWQVYLAHVVFDAAGRLVSNDRLVPLVVLGAPLLEAALELALPEDREPEVLVWALRTDDRRVLWSRAGRAPRWMKTARPSTIATPMQLRPMSQATYLATLRPGRAPELLTLEDG
jgi:hypothetical protein